jgi:uncharacterized membrane protein
VSALRTLYRLWASLLFLAVLVQIGAAGYGAFNVSAHVDKTRQLNEHTFESGFNFHNGLGYAIFVGAAVLFLLALGGRLGRRRILVSLAAVVAVAVQIVLALAGESHPVVGIFHPLNALVVFGLTGTLAHRAWRRDPTA